MPNRSKGRVYTKSDPTGPPGCELGRGLMSLYFKKKKITETRRLYVPRGTKRIGEGHSWRNLCGTILV